MMKKKLSLMLLCAAVAFASCSKDDDNNTPTPVSVSGVTLDKTTLSIEVGKTSTLIATVAPENATDKSAIWSSDKTDIATVSNVGVVEAVKAGTATITVTTTNGGKTATCQVTVTPSPIVLTSITLDGDKTISIGGKVTPVATILPDDATVKTLTWTSSNTAVATVDATTGEVEGKTAGEVTITATATDGSNVTGTCKVTVTKWAIGNLVADGANGAKIGAATDGGLFFQFGSLVGWSATGEQQPSTIAVKPADCTVTSWSEDWTGDPTTENVVTGTGDPCKYYLKGTWRLPTKDEYVALFKDHGYPSTGPWKWENYSATNSTLGLSFPASGFCLNSTGILLWVGTSGSSWSSSLVEDGVYSLDFNSSDMYPGSTGNGRSTGIPVRCVQD